MNKTIKGPTTIPSTANDLKQKQTDDIPKEVQSNKAKAQQQSNVERDTLHTKGRFTADINKISAESKFVINDVVLDIPPIAINIDKNNVHHKWHTIRSKHPSKVKSGHGEINVSLSIYFVRAKAINTGLRRLVAQLEHTPFIYVENGYLRSVIMPGSTSNMSFTVMDFTIRTEPGLVDALVLDLDLQWFNYTPFSPDFKYKKDWRRRGAEAEYTLTDGKLEKTKTSQTSQLAKRNTNEFMVLPGHIGVEMSDPNARTKEESLDESIHYVKRKNSLLETSVAVKSPAESIPYRLFYDQLYRDRSSIIPSGIDNEGILDNQPVLQQSLSFTYYEYKQVALPLGFDFLKVRRPDNSKLSDVVMENLKNSGAAKMKMRWKAARDLESVAMEFKKQTNGTLLTVNSCFRTYEDQVEMKRRYPDKANDPGKSTHEGGLGIDINLNELDDENQKLLVSLMTGKERTLTYGGFKQETKKKGELHHFTHQLENLQKVLKEIYKETDKTAKQRLTSTSEDYDRWLQHQTENGWDQTTGYPRVFRKKRYFALSPSNEIPSPPGNKMVMSSLAISMNNVIASLPVVAHQYATHQYLGSTDKDIFISLSAHGTEQISQLQLMNNVLESNARLFRKVVGSSVVSLGANNILNFMGIKDAIVESIQIDTVEGNPDLFSVDLKMTEWSHIEEEFITEFIGEEDLRDEVIARLLTQIKKEPQARGPVPYGGPGIEWKAEDGKILEGRYTKTPKPVGKINVSVSRDSFLFEKNGLLDKLIAIIKTLNGQLYSKETGVRYVLPHNYDLPLYGAETYVQPYKFSLGGNKSWWGGKISAKTEDLNQKKAITKAREAIGILADEILADYFLEDRFFEDIRRATLLKGTLRNGRPSYPDIITPAHPLTNSPLDTDPDWYFFNQSEDALQAVVMSDAADLGKRFTDASYASYSKINDGSWHQTTYVSPNYTEAKTKEEKFNRQADGYVGPNYNTKDDVEITKQLVIGGDITISDTKKLKKIGKLGVFKDNNKAVIPSNLTPIQLGAGSEGRKSIHDMSNSEDGIQSTFKKSLLNMYNDQNTMRRAFPTFKIYFIDNETTSGRSNASNQSIRGFDDFYSYSAIKDLRVIRSRKIAADLAVMTMTNIAGLLDGKAFYKGKDMRDVKKAKAGPYNPDIRNEESENNPWEGLVLKEGQKVQIRLGYANNPNELETVFNGQIVEVGPTESGDLIQIVCQSYGVELVQQVKGLDVQPDSISDAKNIGDTQELLSTLICEPELVHFGRWVTNPNYSPAEIQSGSTTNPFAFLQRAVDSVRQAATQKWQIANKPQDDNIFAPAQNKYYNAWVKMFELNSLDYYIVHTTIWDVFKEMELRHPGWIAYPQIFEDRYTMFFGVPSQHYWSRSATMAEKKGTQGLKLEREKAEKRRKASNAYLADVAVEERESENSLAGRITVARQPTRAELAHAGKIAGDLNILDDSLALQASRLAADRFIPFRRHHMLTSEHNIIANNITTDSKNAINAVALEYRTSSEIDDMNDFEDNSTILSIKADDNIEDDKTRVFHAAYLNCEKKHMARNYAQGLLLRHMKDIYTGELCIIGDARIKPHDVCYVMDGYTDMFGQIGVEQVTHILSFDSGFVTKIVPDLIVTGNEWYNQPISDAISTIVAPIYHKLGIEWDSITKATFAAGAAGTVAAIGVGLTVAPITFAIGSIVLGVGGFKFFNFTQERQPICVTPLLLHGIPYVAGLSGFKRQNLWSYANGSLRDWVTGKEDGTFQDFQDQLSIQWATYKNTGKFNLFDIVSDILGK